MGFSQRPLVLPDAVHRGEYDTLAMVGDEWGQVRPALRLLPEIGEQLDHAVDLALARRGQVERVMGVVRGHHVHHEYQLTGASSS